jgi:hypothetical protein
MANASGVGEPRCLRACCQAHGTAASIAEWAGRDCTLINQLRPTTMHIELHFGSMEIEPHFVPKHIRSSRFKLSAS